MAKRVTEVETCPRCGGTGEITCPNCGGRGCNNCGYGCGRVTCPRCYGSGTIEVTYTQATNILESLFPDT